MNRPREPKAEDLRRRFQKNNAMKGLILSGLVFPGLGQVVLKSYKRGIALMLTVLACLVMLTVKALEKAFTILERIEATGGIIDLNQITDAATQATTSSDSLTFNTILFLVFLIWIFGSVDAYRIGKKKDVLEHSARQEPDGKLD
jgi:hypothetical protein